MSPDTHSKLSRKEGFTLAEIIIAATISSLLLAGVLAVTLFAARGGYSAGNYSDMESEARTCLDKFGIDARMAKKITWNSVAPTESTTQITLRLTDPVEDDTATNGVDVIYRYDPIARTLSRIGPDGIIKVLVTGIKDGTFSLKGYKVNVNAAGEPYEVADPTDPANRPQASNDCKEVQISLTVLRSRTTVAGSTAKVISARFILRNKPVTI